MYKEVMSNAGKMKSMLQNVSPQKINWKEVPAHYGSWRLGVRRRPGDPSGVGWGGVE